MRLQEGLTRGDEAAGSPQALLRASRRRRLYGAIGGGMLGGGLATLALTALNLWLGKPTPLVWWGLAIGIPFAVGGALVIHRIDD